MIKNYRLALCVAAAIAVINSSGCSDPGTIARPPVKSDPTPPSAMAGASADGTTAPSVPSATESLKPPPAAAPAKAATGGTDDMKKPLTKAAEDAQMPMAGHGNNHSAPDKNAVEAAKPKY
jgi:hypothetical protein